MLAACVSLFIFTITNAAWALRPSITEVGHSDRHTNIGFSLKHGSRRRDRETDYRDFMAASKLKALWNHPAGPKTIHFWAPTCKWGISIANVADFSKPPEKISYPQQIAVTCSGVIWSRYGLVIIPKNWILFSVNVAMAATGIYQLARKVRHDYFSETEVAVVEE